MSEVCCQPRYLQGVIKGTGYLCSCDVCKGQKCHAGVGGKSEHPYKHIFFENRKSIYGVVQELKNNPQEMLFDAIQTVTGSTNNARNFRIWKASYQAATRELQRIYGKDDAAIPS
ncbi:DNA binding protein [Trifolium pratense]|uniref:DNA binding protein n=1 Tax=Trifolium pratense TaxID=57577 RepID=A0A2K3L5F7_TRIPR|nr:DNA binding protein [Trifolium pratense]